MEKIKVKAFINGWHETTREKAREFIKNLYNGITTTSDNQKRLALCDKHLQGITAEELLKEKTKNQ